MSIQNHDWKMMTGIPICRKCGQGEGGAKTTIYCTGEKKWPDRTSAKTVEFAAGRGSGKTELIHEQVTGKPLFPPEKLVFSTRKIELLPPEKRVVVTISSGTFEDRCALAQMFSQLLDNFAITHERSKGQIPYSELEMLGSDTSVKICVETE